MRGLRSLVAGGSWSTALLVVQMLYSTAVQIILLRTLATSDYGVYTLIITAVGALTPLCSLSGLSNSLMNGMATSGGTSIHPVFRLKLFAGAMAGLAITMIGLVSPEIRGTEGSPALVLVLALVAPFLWMDVHLAYWQGQRRFDLLFIEGLTIRSLSLAVLLALLAVQADVLSVVVAVVVLPALMGLVASIRIVKCAPRRTESTDLRFGWQLWRLGASLGLLAALDKFVVGAMAGTEALAVYVVAEMVFRCGFTVPSGVLATVAQPHLAAMTPTAARVWVQRHRFMLVAGFAALGIALAGALALADRFLLDGKYEGAIGYAWVFAGCVVARSPSAMLGALFKAHGLRRATNATAAVMASGYVLAPIGFLIAGMTGLMAARLISSLAVGMAFVLTQRLDDQVTSSEGIADGNVSCGESL